MTRIASDYLYDSLELGYIKGIEIRYAREDTEDDVIFFDNRNLKVRLRGEGFLTKEDFYQIIHNIHSYDMTIEMN